jgi:hypothetical protein
VSIRAAADFALTAPVLALRAPFALPAPLVALTAVRVALALLCRTSFAAMPGGPKTH